MEHFQILLPAFSRPWKYGESLLPVLAISVTVCRKGSPSPGDSKLGQTKECRLLSTHVKSLKWLVKEFLCIPGDEGSQVHCIL